MKDKYADQVTDHIDHIGYDRNIHRSAGLPDAAVKRRPCVIDRQRRIGIRGYPKVCPACLHNVLFHPSEYQPKNQPSKQQKQKDDTRRKNRGDHQQLARRLPRFRRLSAPDILAYNDRAAGSKGREQENEDRIERIDKGHTGYGGFPHKADHKSVRQSHKDREKLLQKQRQDQIFQIFVTEHLS